MATESGPQIPRNPKPGIGNTLGKIIGVLFWSFVILVLIQVLMWGGYLVFNLMKDYSPWGRAGKVAIERTFPVEKTK